MAETASPLAVEYREKNQGYHVVRCECCDERLPTGSKAFRLGHQRVGYQPNTSRLRAWLCEACGAKVLRAIVRASAGVAS